MDLSTLCRNFVLLCDFHDDFVKSESAWVSWTCDPIWVFPYYTVVLYLPKWGDNLNLPFFLHSNRRGLFGTKVTPRTLRPFLFNGDFVDRGSWSIEVALLIFAMKMKNPTSVFMNRGNHEMLEANMIYGFAGEVGAKYDLDLFNLFSESFRNLPLLHLINNEVLVVHAGIPGPRPRVWLPGQTHDPEDAVPVNARATTLAEIAAVDRYTELTPNSYKEAVDNAPRQEEKWETDSRMIIDFLWSDPRGGAGYGPSYRKSRGVFMFGPDVTEQFCRENSISLVIRSHEVKAEGWLKDHDTLMSVFSAPNYLDTGGNKGAFLQLTPGPGGKLQALQTWHRNNTQMTSFFAVGYTCHLELSRAHLYPCVITCHNSSCPVRPHQLATWLFLIQIFLRCTTRCFFHPFLIFIYIILHRRGNGTDSITNGFQSIQSNHVVSLRLECHVNWGLHCEQPSTPYKANEEEAGSGISLQRRDVFTWFSFHSLAALAYVLVCSSALQCLFIFSEGSIARFWR